MAVWLLLYYFPHLRITSPSKWALCSSRPWTAASSQRLILQESHLVSSVRTVLRSSTYLCKTSYEPVISSSYMNKSRYVKAFSRIYNSSILIAFSQTSVNLLDSLEGFLSTFQKDLSAVSGQISNLQDRSKDIDNRLKSRRVSGMTL